MIANVLVLVPLLSSCCCGLGIVAVFGRSLRKESPLLALSLAFPLGTGFTSALYFLGRTCGVHDPFWLRLMDLVVLSFGMCLWLSLAPVGERCSLFFVEKVRTWHVAALVGLLFFSALAGYGFAREYPHGAWDAYAIYNLKARFLACWGPEWRDLFSPQYRIGNEIYPLDYPLLLPVALARMWLWVPAGMDALWCGTLLAWCFLVSTGAVLFAGLLRARGLSVAVLGACACLGASDFQKVAFWQYADVPVALYLLIAVTLLHHGHCVLLAGCALGCAAWTKNEGLLILFIVLLLHGSTCAWRSGARGGVRQVALYFAGAALPLVALGVLKWGFAPSNYLMKISSSTWDRFADSSRYWDILMAYLQELFGLGRGLFLLTLCCLVADGFVRRRWKAPVATFPLQVVLALAAAYFLVFVSTPVELAFHLKTALFRLLLQLWPVWVLGVFHACGERESTGLAETTEL